MVDVPEVPRCSGPSRTGANGARRFAVPSASLTAPALRARRRAVGTGGVPSLDHTSRGSNRKLPEEALPAEGARLTPSSVPVGSQGRRIEQGALGEGRANPGKPCIVRCRRPSRSNALPVQGPEQQTAERLGQIRRWTAGKAVESTWDRANPQPASAGFLEAAPAWRSGAIIPPRVAGAAGWDRSGRHRRGLRGSRADRAGRAARRRPGRWVLWGRGA